MVAETPLATYYTVTSVDNQDILRGGVQVSVGVLSGETLEGTLGDNHISPVDR